MADVFAMPSRSRLGGLEVEGLGIVFLEAAACEKPTIIGRSGGTPDTLDDGVTGYLVDPRDTHDIANRIVELLSDPERARAMGVAGRERAARAWTWDAAAGRILGYLSAAEPRVP